MLHTQDNLLPESSYISSSDSKGVGDSDSLLVRTVVDDGDVMKSRGDSTRPVIDRRPKRGLLRAGVPLAFRRDGQGNSVDVTNEGFVGRATSEPALSCRRLLLQQTNRMDSRDTPIRKSTLATAIPIIAACLLLPDPEFVFVEDDKASQSCGDNVGGSVTAGYH